MRISEIIYYSTITPIDLIKNTQ